jgi:hypothetical protein
MSRVADKIAMVATSATKGGETRPFHYLPAGFLWREQNPTNISIPAIITAMNE